MSLESSLSIPGLSECGIFTYTNCLNAFAPNTECFRHILENRASDLGYYRIVRTLIANKGKVKEKLKNTVEELEPLFDGFLLPQLDRDIRLERRTSRRLFLYLECSEAEFHKRQENGAKLNELLRLFDLDRRCSVFFQENTFHECSSGYWMRSRYLSNNVEIQKASGNFSNAFKTSLAEFVIRFLFASRRVGVYWSGLAPRNIIHVEGQFFLVDTEEIYCNLSEEEWLEFASFLPLQFATVFNPAEINQIFDRLFSRYPLHEMIFQADEFETKMYSSETISATARLSLLRASIKIDWYSSSLRYGAPITRFWSDQLPLVLEVSLTEALSKISNYNTWRMAVTQLTRAMRQDQTDLLLSYLVGGKRANMFYATRIRALDYLE